MSITVQDLTAMESRILTAMENRFIQHEEMEMLIAENTHKILERHDILIIGPNGNGGMQKDITKLESGFKVLCTKMKTWYTVVSLFIGSGGLFLIYTISKGA